MVAASKKFLQLFTDKGLITEDQLAEAMELQRRENRFVGTIMVERGWLSSDQLMEALSEHYRLPLVHLDEAQIPAEAVASVPLRVALHYQIMPVRLQHATLTVAIANPQDIRMLDELRLALQQRYAIEPVLASAEDIIRAVKKYYGVGADTIDRLVTDRASSPALASQEPEALEDLEHVATEASVVKLVNQLILEAHTRRATDIHLEPFRNTVKLRYRVDGLLHEVDMPATIRQLFPAIISRIKVLSNLNIVERRLPQDGRASVKVGEQKLDLRISVLPTPFGESIVIRILPSQMLLGLRDLGFRAEDMKLLEAVVHKSHGLMFVTGPTGSGKTTTLYGCLNTINTKERKIITIEDPIEYELEGITQVQVNPQIGLTFAQGLRSMLRHDPNVMMVGEVRDLETAELAIRIALTGHMVLSTIHTNDAVGGIARLTDMGIDPFLIASSVECLLAQRLVRLLCEHCKETAPVKRPDMPQMFRSRGCTQCHQTGFHGRTAIYELLLMSQPVKDLILQRAPADTIRKAAVELGMRTMRDDGWGKVQAGLTTLDEVLRVTQEDV